MPLYEYRIVMSRVDATHHSQRSPFPSGPLPLSLPPLTGTAAVAAAAAPRRAARSERQHLVPARRNVRRSENAAVRAVDGHHVPEHAPRTHTHRPTISGSAAPAKLSAEGSLGLTGKSNRKKKADGTTIGKAGEVEQ